MGRGSRLLQPKRLQTDPPLPIRPFQNPLFKWRDIEGRARGSTPPPQLASIPASCWVGTLCPGVGVPSAVEKTLPAMCPPPGGVDLQTRHEILAPGQRLMRVVLPPPHPFPHCPFQPPNGSKSYYNGGRLWGRADSKKIKMPEYEAKKASRGNRDPEAR